MVPAQSQPSTSKRKLSDDPNALSVPAKKTKTDNATKPGKPFKRKLVGEEVRGGLVIIRAPPTRPPSSQDNSTDSQPHPQTSSKPSSSQQPPAEPPPGKPPLKKLKTNDASVPPPRQNGNGKDREVLGVAGPRSEPEVDEDVRQMQSETDALRKQSKQSQSLSADTSNPTLDPSYQYPPTTPDPPRTPNPRDRIRETSQPLHTQETPQIHKNKMMRGETIGLTPRRRSSISRGKRVSSSYENTGVIDIPAQPHTSVADSTFYKHIDVELPEPQRAQQLLIWCSHRSVNEFLESNPAPTSKRDTKSAGKDPPISAEDRQLLKSVQEDVIKMLAEKKIDTNVFTPPGSHPPEPLKENEQNVRNRAREKKFSDHIQRSKLEEEAWAQVDNFHKSHQSTVLADIGRREKELFSGKSKGKQRATLEDLASWDIDERDLPDHLRGPDGIELAKSIVSSGTEQKSRLSEKLTDLEFTTDRIHALTHSVLETTRVAESDLDRRFALLHLSLSSRSQPIRSDLSSSKTILSSYLPPNSTRPASTTDPQDLLRALSRVDAERPQTQVGDAARRAVKEVQRAHDTSGRMTERRLTEVPPPTPRKPPGTPRRPTTPGKGR